MTHYHGGKGVLLLGCFECQAIEYANAPDVVRRRLFADMSRELGEEAAHALRMRGEEIAAGVETRPVETTDTGEGMDAGIATRQGRESDAGGDLFG
jgi:hypothetical protein